MHNPDAPNYGYGYQPRENPSFNINPPPRFTDGPCQADRIEPVGPVDSELARVWRTTELINAIIDTLTDRIAPYLVPESNAVPMMKASGSGCDAPSSTLGQTIRGINDRLDVVQSRLIELTSRVER